MIGTGMEQDFKRDGLVSQILRRLGDAEQNIRSLLLKTPPPLWLPFSTYAGISPFAAFGQPFSVTIDRSLNLIKWTQTYIPVAPNDGANYWVIDMVRVYDGAAIASMNTSADAGSVWAGQLTGTFAINPLDTTTLGIVIQVTPVGAPGVIILTGPAVQVGNI